MEKERYQIVLHAKFLVEFGSLLLVEENTIRTDGCFIIKCDWDGSIK